MHTEPNFADIDNFENASHTRKYDGHKQKRGCDTIYYFLPPVLKDVVGKLYLKDVLEELKKQNRLVLTKDGGIKDTFQVYKEGRSDKSSTRAIGIIAFGDKNQISDVTPRDENDDSNIY